MKPSDVDRLLDWLEQHATDRAGRPRPLMPWQRRLLEDLLKLEPGKKIPVIVEEARRSCRFRPRS